MLADAGKVKRFLLGKGLEGEEQQPNNTTAYALPQRQGRLPAREVTV